MNKAKTWASLLPLLIIAAGCQDPAVLTSVTLEKGYDVDAVVKIETAKKSISPSRVFEIPRSDSEETLEFENLPTHEIDLELRYNGEQNLPSGVTRNAIIRAKIQVSGDLEHPEQPPEINLPSKQVTVLVNGKRDRAINCRRLFEFTGEPHALKIRFRGFNSLATCDGKELVESSPLYIGQRDVTRPDTKIGRIFAPNLFSQSSEDAMGREFVDAFNAENAGYILDASHPTTQYMQRLMESIARASDSPNITPHVFVINADVLNAFALPGGYVYVFRGLIDAAKTEAEVVGVLGHEWAHVTARHGTRNMSRAIMKILGGQIVGGVLEFLAIKSRSRVLRTIGPVIQEATVVGAYLHLLHKGRQAESEADRLGSQYAWAVGYQPWGLAGMFETFKQLSGDYTVTSIEKLLSSHPDHDTRISNVLDLSGLFYPVKPDYLSTTEDFELARDAIDAEPKTDISMSEMLGLRFAESVNGMVKARIESEVLTRSEQDESSSETSDQ